MSKRLGRKNWRVVEAGKLYLRADGARVVQMFEPQSLHARPWIARDDNGDALRDARGRVRRFGGQATAIEALEKAAPWKAKRRGEPK